jgi:hypothetical protein
VAEGPPAEHVLREESEEPLRVYELVAEENAIVFRRIAAHIPLPNGA